MLRPQDTATRERKNLDGLWDFRIDRDGVGRDQNWQAGPLPESRPMAVPASFNDLVLDKAGSTVSRSGRTRVATCPSSST